MLRIILLAFALLLPGRAAAQPSPQTGLEALVQGWARPGPAPGTSLIVIRDGRILYEHQDGLADLALDVPIGPATRFAIASVSKQFTAACIALLVERGRLSLDDRLRRHVPELGQVYDGITVRQLLHHSSGIRDFHTLLDTQGRTDDVNSPADIIALLARQRALRFPPGTRYEYSNSGYFLLGLIVERVSGTSLAAFARDNLFRPLGMADTLFFDDPRLVVPNLATGYLPRRGGGFAQVRSLYALAGNAGIVTTARDLARWDRVYSVNALNLRTPLTAPGALADGSPVDYGWGLELGRYRGLRVVRHSGGFGGFVAELMRFPEHNLTIIYLTNERGSIDPTERAYRIADLLLADRLGPAETPAPSGPAAPARPQPAPPAPPADLAAFAGAYYSEELQVTFEVALVDGALRIRHRHVLDAPLVPAGGDAFRIFGALPVEFARDSRGRVVSFTPKGGGARDISFVRRP